MTARSKQLGAHGEQLAASYLEGAGYRILDRNWRCRHGELDIVAVGPDSTLVIVEVKTRSGHAFGHPLAAVTPQKVARLRLLTGIWLAENPYRGAVRLDVIAVTSGQRAALEHLRGVGG